MSPVKIVAIALIVAGVLGLIYGGFAYTRSTHEGSVGPFSFSVEDKERVNIPAWAGVAAVVVGGILLVVGKRE